MKKVIMTIMMAIFLLLGCSCAASPVDRYDNFLNDLDAFTRMQTALQQAKDGGEMTLYVKEDMQTLEEDLQMLRVSEQEIVEINDCFLDTVRALRQNADCMETGDEEGAVSFYENAAARFDEGFLMFAQLVPSGGASYER